MIINNMPGSINSAGSATHPIYINSNGEATATTYALDMVSISQPGLMSAADKTKLNGIAAGATANTGTVTGVTIQATSPINVDSSSTITTSGTRTLSHANSGVSAGTYGSTTTVPQITVNATGHITGVTNQTIPSGGVSWTHLGTLNSSTQYIYFQHAANNPYGVFKFVINAAVAESPIRISAYGSSSSTGSYYKSGLLSSTLSAGYQGSEWIPVTLTYYTFLKDMGLSSDDSAYYIYSMTMQTITVESTSYTVYRPNYIYCNGGKTSTVYWGIAATSDDSGIAYRLKSGSIAIYATQSI